MRGDFMYEYLASVQSAVRRINDRITTLTSKFGNNSKVVNDIKAKLDVLLPDNMRYKDGKPQISKPSDIFGDDEKMQAISDLDENMKTWGEYRQEYESEYFKYSEEADFFGEKKLSMPDFIQTISNLDSALREIPSDQLPNEALNILKTKGKRKTYAELFKVTQILQEKGMV